jgi:hypothetical protein
MRMPKSRPNHVTLVNMGHLKEKTDPSFTLPEVAYIVTTGLSREFS